MIIKIRLQGLGEEVSKKVYLDIILSGPTKAPEFKFIREMHYREEFTSVDRLQELANRFYVDQQSRNASGLMASGLGGDGGVLIRPVSSMQGVRAFPA